MPCLTNLYLRVHLTPYSPDPKSFILDICRVNPHQLAPTVGTRGVGIMNSMAFLLLDNSNPEVDGKQEIELTIGSLNFRVGSSGSLAFQIQQNWIRRQAKSRQSQCQDHQWAPPAR
jgi:hypothetical protein